MNQKEISFNNPLMKYLLMSHPIKNDGMGLPSYILIGDKLNKINSSIDRHNTRKSLIQSLTSLHNFSQEDATFMGDCYCELAYIKYKEVILNI